MRFLGAKSGRLRQVQQGLGKVDKADKPAAGKRFNEVKQQIEGLLAEAQARGSEAGIQRGWRGLRLHRSWDPFASGTAASDHSNDRRHETDHGTAGIHGGRRS